MFSGKQNKCKWQNRIRHPTEGLPASLGTDEITNYSFRPVQLLFFFLFLVKLHPIIYFFLIRLGPKHKNSTNKPGPLLYVFVSISGVKEFRWSGQVLSVSWRERIPLICTKKKNKIPLIKQGLFNSLPCTQRMVSTLSPPFSIYKIKNFPYKYPHKPQDSHTISSSLAFGIPPTQAFLVLNGQRIASLRHFLRCPPRPWFVSRSISRPLALSSMLQNLSNFY